jgi:hypothetical protein
MDNFEYEIKSNYGQGWEVVTTETTANEARKRLIEYIENEPMYPHKIVIKKISRK